MICLTMEQHSEYAFQWALQNLLLETDKVCLLMVAESKYGAAFSSRLGVPSNSNSHSQLHQSCEREEKEIARSQFVQSCKAWLASKEAQMLQKFPLLITDTLVLCPDCPQHCGYDPLNGPVTVADSDVRDQIVETSLRLKPDLLVMGAKAQGKLKRALLGSVSDYCMHHCTCPVLIIKQ